jgi:hypothetical protein
MPDWKQIVHRNLRVLRACSPEFAEELAAHLEDSYAALLREGVAPEVAFNRTMNQIEGRRRSWLTLHFLKEELMNGLTRMTGFIRKIALPGLLTFATYAFTMNAWMFVPGHIHSKIYRIEFYRLFDVPFVILPLGIWCMLCLLPICGALGALLSQRNGGSRPQRMAAALFPSEIIGTLFLLVFVDDFIISRFLPGYWWNTAVVLKEFWLFLLEFVVLPAAFLLLGAGVVEKIGKPHSQTPCSM